MEPSDKSCYVLELSVGPGGSRWAELHTYSDPGHLRAILERFCRNPDGFSAYHAIWYGAVLGVWVVQLGKTTAFIDLHPFIRARLGDKPPQTLDDKEGCLGLVIEARSEKDDDDDFQDGDIETYAQMKLEADWTAVAARLPALEAPLLSPRQQTRIVTTIEAPAEAYFPNEEALEFGSYDPENLEAIAGPEGV